MSPIPATEARPRSIPEAAVARNAQEIADLGGELQPPITRQGAVGVTLFDTPASDDGTVTVVLPIEQLDQVANRTFVRIRTEGDGGATARSFLGVVSNGPFHEPDGLRGDSPIITTTAVRGGTMFLPRYHGRAEVQILGEEVQDGSLHLQPPRFRPRPNSPVFLLAEDEVCRFLKVEGDILLGRAVGYDNLQVKIPSADKGVLPRHLAVLGSTGSGKSTTVSRLIAEAQARGLAIVVLDVEPEYVQIDEATEDPTMLALLAERGQHAAGIPSSKLRRYSVVGSESATPSGAHPVTLAFDALPPATIAEILEMNEAQQERFQRAYDLAVELLVESTPAKTPSDILEWDELERGFPGITLDMVYDVVRALADKAQEASEERQRKKGEPVEPSLPQTFYNGIPRWRELLAARLAREPRPHSYPSWRKVQGKLSAIRRLKIFDNPRGEPIVPRELVRPSTVNVFDLSSMESPVQRNLVIAEVLRMVQEAQEESYKRNSKRPPTLVIIEEAHEFISAERIKQMPTLFGQIARIARRGRKRRLGLCFVSQSPQHLPREILGLVNNVILHRLTDAAVIRDLRQAFGAVDDGLWRQLGTLAPGQAVVSFTSISQPLLVAMDPTPVKLRLID